VRVGVRAVGAWDPNGDRQEHDAGRPVLLRRLVVTTDKPGYVALIEAGPSATGPFRPVSATRTLAATTAFSVHGSAQRFYLVWIVRLDHVADVNELRGFG
jgi:hypothetical protein